MFSKCCLMRFIVYIVLSLLQLCSSQDESSGNNAKSLSTSKPTVYNAQMQKEIQDAMACFTVNMAKEINTMKRNSINKNVIFSPLDMYAALALAHFGSSGDTRNKLGKVLGLKPEVVRSRRSSDVVQGENFIHQHQTIGGLLYEFKQTPGTNISLTEGVYVDQSHAIKSTYYDGTKFFYDVQVRCADFRNDNNGSTEGINSWVDEETRQRTPQYFKDPVPRSTDLIIFSTLYFSGTWLIKFDSAKSYMDTFQTGRDDGCDDDENVQVCIMENTAVVLYVNHPVFKVQAIGLPMEDNDIIFYFVLPETTDQLQTLINSPNKKRMQYIIDNAKEELVHYRIPKVTVKEHIDLLQLIKQMGMSELSENDIADNVKTDIFDHYVDIELNEENTIGGEVLCPPGSDDEEVPGTPIEFIVNRPFVFFAYDKKTKLFLYYGLIYNPISKE